MRIRADNPEHHRFEVTLGGISVDLAVEADDVQGWVDVLVMLNRRVMAMTPDAAEVLHRVYGEVKITRLP